MQNYKGGWADEILPDLNHPLALRALREPDCTIFFSELMEWTPMVATADLRRSQRDLATSMATHINRYLYRGLIA